MRVLDMGQIVLKIKKINKLMYDKETSIRRM